VSDEIPKDLPLAPNGEVKAYDRLGNKITVPKDRVGELYAMGGRVARKQEVSEAQAEADYAKQSTARKIATVATMAGPIGYPAHLALRAQGSQLPPELESYTQGVSEGMTGGLASVGMKEAIGAVGGDQAAHEYGQTAQRAVEAKPEYHTAGVGAGFVGSAIAGGPKAGLGKAGGLIPGTAISQVGGAVERAVAGRLAQTAERSVVARALSTGTELAARGAVEGALYAGAQQYSEANMGDHELNADKLFAAVGMGALGGGVGGGVLGFGGSLAASGARKAVGGVSNAISRAMRKGEAVVADATARAEATATEAQTALQTTLDNAQMEIARTGAQAHAAAKEGVARAAEDAVASAKGIAEVTSTSAAQEATAFEKAVAKAANPAEQKGWAFDQAWKAIGAGQGLQSTAYAKRAAKYLPNGTRDVGEVLMRKGVINAEDGLIDAMRSGTPEHMLPKIEAARESVGQRLGAITEANPARVPVGDIDDAFERILGPLRKKAGFEPVANAVEQYRASLYDKLGLADPLLPRSEVKGLKLLAPIQDVLEQRKALDQLVYQEAKTLDPKGRVASLREFRTELEGLIAKSLDDASGDVPGALLGEYKGLKKDFLALSIAAEAAEDSAARMSKAGTFGLRDMIAGAGGGITGALTTAGHKVIRERGNAAAAVLVHRMADSGALTKMVQSIDAAIGKAAKGVLAAPKALKAPEKPVGTARQRGEAAMKQIAEWQANPEAFADKVARNTEAMSSTTPQLAGAFAQRFTSGLAFLASKVPVKPDVDPFDPHKAPRLSDAEAHTLAQYMWYWEKPERVFEEASRGKLTYEGVETLKAMPGGLFQALQTQVAVEMADMISKGVAPPYGQREKLGALLDFPAVPSQRPEHMQLLQSCVQVPEGTTPDKPQGPSRPLPTKTQPSSFDRVESR